MYHVFLTREAVKESRKRGKEFESKVGEILKELADNPRNLPAERLAGKLNFIYSHHFNFHGTSFRLCFTIDDVRMKIIVVLLGSRENFYKILRHKLSI